MASILILGATGLVGNECLQQAVGQERIARITVIARSPIVVHHQKINSVTMPLEEMDRRSDLFSVDAVICALGTTMKKAGSREAFRKVDFELPLNAATIALSQGVKHFLLVSALGANARSSFFYNRVKGEIEEKIANLPFERITIVRPSLLLGERKEFRFGERIAQIFTPIIPASFKPVHAHDVAKALLTPIFVPGSGITIIESRDIRSFS